MLVDEVIRIDGRREVNRGQVFCPVRDGYLPVEVCTSCEALERMTLSDGDGTMHCVPRGVIAGWSGDWAATPDR